MYEAQLEKDWQYIQLGLGNFDSCKRDNYHLDYSILLFVTYHQFSNPSEAKLVLFAG
jgi:hypothetical protein